VSVEVIGLKAALGKFEPRDGLMITARADAGEMAAEVRVGSGPLVVVSDGLNVDDL
jgi:hypothetical protein